MAALTAQQRADTTLELIRNEIVAANLMATLTTVELRDLVNAMDDYLEANAVLINSAIPLPLRTNASAKMKALAMGYAALKRAKVAT